MAYWSTADDDPPTYHTCSNCRPVLLVLRRICCPLGAQPRRWPSECRGA